MEASGVCMMYLLWAVLLGALLVLLIVKRRKWGD